MSEQLGWLDTNIFVHRLFLNDEHFERCRQITQALEAGEAEGWIDVVVVHELTYVLSRHGLFRTRQDVYAYIRNLLLLAGVNADDKEALILALTRWANSSVGFADAWLATLAQRRGVPVCSVNRHDLTGVENAF
jgi:predicted nucleic acid-binding protein